MPPTINSCYETTAQELEALSQEDQAGLYKKGYRLIKTINNDTVVLLALSSDGSLQWLGCNQPRDSLLHNGNFAIAQAGYGGFHGAALYAADMWLYNGEAGQVSFNNGLIIKTQYTVYQRTQNALNDGKTRTVVVRTATSTGCLILEGGYVPVGATGYSATYDTGKAVYINKNTADASALVSVELYEGNYTSKTLPPWEKPDYALEMQNCQQFFEVCSRNVLLTCVSVSSSTAVLRIFIPYATTKRAGVTPTIIAPSTISLYFMNRSSTTLYDLPTSDVTIYADEHGSTGSISVPVNTIQQGDILSLYGGQFQVSRDL